MPWLQDHNPNINWRQQTIGLINWNKEQGQTLSQITQVINPIKREEPLLDDIGGSEK
jgi:hypothetical protein